MLYTASTLPSVCRHNRNTEQHYQEAEVSQRNRAMLGIIEKVFKATEPYIKIRECHFASVHATITVC